VALKEEDDEATYAKMIRKAQKFIRQNHKVSKIISDEIYVNEDNFDILSFQGVYRPNSFSSDLLRSGINPKQGSRVLVLGPGSGIDSLVAANRGAAEVVSVGISPQEVDCSLFNIENSVYSENIHVYWGDLFNIPAKPLEGKFNHIYFNMPLSFNTEKTSDDKTVSDPGRKLLKRLLKEADNFLDDLGTLEIANYDDPLFWLEVYRNGWIPIRIEGVDMCRKYVPKEFPYDYVKFTLLHKKDSRPESPNVISEWEKLAPINEYIQGQRKMTKDEIKRHMMIVKKLYKKYSEIDRFEEQLLAKGAFTTILMMDYDVSEFHKFDKYPTPDPYINEFYYDFFDYNSREEKEDILEPQSINKWLGDALTKYAQILETEKFDFSKHINNFSDFVALNKLADRLTQTEIKEALNISDEDAEIIQNILRYQLVNPQYLTAYLEEQIGPFEYDKFAFPALLNLYIDHVLQASRQKDKAKTFRNIGPPLDKETINQIESFKEKWSKIAQEIDVLNYSFEINGPNNQNQQTIVRAKILFVGEDLPENVQASLISSNDDHLIIAVRGKSNEINFLDEILYHESREVFWINQGLSSHEAHKIASIEQAISFSEKGNLTTNHQSQIENLSKNELKNIIDEYNSGSRIKALTKIIEKNNSILKDYFTPDIFDFIRYYEAQIKMKALYSLYMNEKSLGMPFKKNGNDRRDLISQTAKDWQIVEDFLGIKGLKHSDDLYSHTREIPLTRFQEAALVLMYRIENNGAALQTLIKYNLRYIKLLVYGQLKKHPGFIDRTEDLVNEAVLAFITAADYIDIKKGFTLKTYAKRPILQSVAIYIAKNSECITPTNTDAFFLYKLLRAEKLYFQRFGILPDTYEEIIKYDPSFDITKEKYDQLLMMRKTKFLHMDKPIGNNGNNGNNAKLSHEMIGFENYDIFTEIAKKNISIF